MEGYILWAASASAGSPILYGRFRPMPGELPKGTVIETFLCQLKICHFYMRFKLMEHKERASMTNFLET